MYYTYAHYTPNGEIFYIGKGKEDRAFSRHDRSYKWREIVQKARGISIEILADWDTEEEAFSHEMLLIDCFKSMGANLVNQSNGGVGPNGAMLSPETKAKISAAHKGRKYEIIICPKCQKSGGATSMKRWHFDKCTGNRLFKARATKDGKRHFLGNFESKEAVKIAIDNFLKV